MRGVSSMEEINLKELWDFFLERIWIVVLSLVVFLVIGNVYSIFLKTPLYQSNTTIVLVNADSQNQTITSSDIQLNKNLVDTYSQIIRSRKVISQVKENMNLEDYSVGELTSRVSVSALDETEIIKVVVTDEDSALAAAIADEIARVFSKEIKNYYNIENVQVLDEAVESSVACNKNIIKENVIYVLGSLVISCGIIFVIFYFDSTVKSRELVEEKFGLTVLGVVPLTSKE